MNDGLVLLAAWTQFLLALAILVTIVLRRSGPP